MCKFVQFFSIALCLSVAVLLENSARFMSILLAQDVSAPKSEEAAEESRNIPKDLTMSIFPMLLGRTNPNGL